MAKAKKLSLVISLVLIIVGIIMYVAMGFNYNLEYGAGKRILVTMKNDFNVEDYKSMAKEIYKEAKVEVISEFKDGVSIKVKDTTDEQLEKLVSKVNEKYGYEYKKEDIKVSDVSKVKVIDIVKQAIVPSLVGLLIVLVYTLVRYRKLGTLKILYNALVPSILAVLLVFAVYLIFRIPVTNVLLPLVLTAYVIGMMYTAKKFEDIKE